MAKTIGTEARGKENRMDFLRRQLIAAAKDCRECKGSGFIETFIVDWMVDGKVISSKSFKTWWDAKREGGARPVRVEDALCGCQRKTKELNCVEADDWRWSRDS